MSAPPTTNRLPPSIQALGLDPNRIEQARPEVRAAFYAAQAEQQRQAEAEARKQAQLDAEAEQKRIDALRAANSRAASDPLAQRGKFMADVQDALKTGHTIKTLQDMGYDIAPGDSLTFSGSQFAPKNIRVVKPQPRELPTIDYAAEAAQDFAAFRNLENKGQNPLSLSVVRNYGNSRTQMVDPYTNSLIPLSLQGTYTTPVLSRPSRTPEAGSAEYYTKPKTGAIENLQGFNLVPVPTTPSTPESPVFGSLTLSQAKAAFQNPYKPDMSATERGYAQLQQAQQQAGEYYTKPVFGSLTASQAANALYIPNMKAQEAAMAANIKEATTKRYAVNFDEDLGVNTKTAGPQSALFYDPTMPFAVTDNPRGPLAVRLESNPAQSNQRFTIPGGFVENFQNYFSNIPKSVIGIVNERVLNKDAPTLAPEVEGQAYSGLLNFGVRAAQGTPANVNLLLFSKDMGDIGLAIKENPLGAAGSLAGTAAFTALTLGTGQLGKLGKGALSFINSIGKADKVGEQAAKSLLGITDVSTQAFKVSKTGEELPLTQTGRVFTQTKQITVPALFRSTVKGLPQTPINLKFPAEFAPGPLKFNVKVPARADIFRISKDAEDLGVFSLKSGKGQMFANGLNDAEKAALVEAPNTPATAITDIYKSEAGVLPRVSVPVVTGPLEKEAGSVIVQADRFSGKVAASRFTGANLIEFSTKRAAQLADMTAKRNAQISAASAALMEISGKGKPFIPLEFGAKSAPKIGQGSRTALETINEASFDKELSKFATKSVTEAGSSASSLSKPLGLYGGKTAIEVRGGSQGAQSDAAVYDEMLGVGPTPASATKPTVKNQLVNVPATRTGVSAAEFLRNLSGQGTKQGRRDFVDLMVNGKPSVKEVPGLDTVNIPLTGNIPLVTPLETPMQTPQQTPVQVPVTTPVIPTTKTPPERQFRPPPVRNTNARRGRNGNPFSVFYGESVWNVVNFGIDEKALRDLGFIGSTGKSRRK